MNLSDQKVSKGVMVETETMVRASYDVRVRSNAGMLSCVSAFQAAIHIATSQEGVIPMIRTEIVVSFFEVNWFCEGKTTWVRDIYLLCTLRMLE